MDTYIILAGYQLDLRHVGLGLDQQLAETQKIVQLKYTGRQLTHYLTCYIKIMKWPASREKGPSEITNSVAPDQPQHDFENSNT